MSDTNTIKMNNGSSITADLGFASKTTTEQWLTDLLRLLKSNKMTSGYFASDSLSDYEVNPLPLPLINTTQLNSDILTNKRDFANERAEREARIYASKFYDKDNKNDAEFFKTHMPQFIASVKQAFSSADGSNGRVRILSQKSFLKLSQAYVNILLCKKPDGTDNMRRRCKVKPGVFDVDADGNKFKVYYTAQEIAAAEVKMYDDKKANNFLDLDMEYIPFTVENTLLTASTLLDVTRTERSDVVDESSIEEIFASSDEDSMTVRKQFDELLVLAQRDLTIISLIEDRNTSGDILPVVHADCTGTPVPESSYNKLTMREKYISLMLFVRIIIILIAPLIDAININAWNVSLSKTEIQRIIGIDSSVEGNFLEIFGEMLKDDDFKQFVGSLPFKYRISEHMFIVLMINLLRRATVNSGVSAKKLVDAFATHIGYQKYNGNHKNITEFFKYINLNIPETAVEDLQGLINTCEGRREPMASYAYRNTRRYLTNSGTFGIELAILDSCYNITDYRISGSRKTAPIRYNMTDNNFTFSIDTLVNTVSRIMAMGNLTDAINPFAAYKAEIVEKEQALFQRRQMVAAEIEEIYGTSFPAFFVKLPPIPYNNSERLWARAKCVTLEEEIKIITEFNPSYDWESFKSTMNSLEKLTREYAISEYDDPDLVESIRINTEIFENMCRECNLTSDNLNKLKKLMNNLRIYSNLDEFQGSFEPFKFDFKKNLGDTMDFHLSKTSILYNGNLRTVQSLSTNPDLHRILGDYFLPFFVPYATINTEDFEIKFTSATRIDSKSKNPDNAATITDVIMHVKFGSSDDVHVCSKFRTRFPCILDTERMIKEAREDAGKTINDEFVFADIADKFIIKWNRNDQQQHILAGNNGESVLALIASTRGAYEQFPAYDSMMNRIVVNAFKISNERYYLFLARRKAEEDRKNGTIGGGYGSYVKEIGFGEMSDTSKANNEHNRNLWSQLTMNMKGESVNSVNTLENITQINAASPFGSSTNNGNSGVSKQPFGQKKTFGSRMGKSSYGDRKGGLSTENTHGNTDGSENAIRTLTRERSTKKWITDDNGYKTFVYEKKTITSYVRTGNSTPQELREKRERAGKTPSRHERGVIPNNNNGQRPRHATGSNSHRNGTPSRRTPNASKATPVSLGASPASTYRQGAASPYRPSSNSVSPAAAKRGYAPGAASPSGFDYFQPDHNVQTGFSTSTNVYGGGAASPAQSQHQFFQEIEVPIGIFHAENTTPRDNGSRGSQSSRGTGYDTLNGSVATPTQDFTVNNDDDFDI